MSEIVGFYHRIDGEYRALITRVRVVDGFEKMSYLASFSGYSVAQLKAKASEHFTVNRWESDEEG